MGSRGDMNNKVNDIYQCNKNLQIIIIIILSAIIYMLYYTIYTCIYMWYICIFMYYVNICILVYTKMQVCLTVLNKFKTFKALTFYRKWKKFQISF